MKRILLMLFFVSTLVSLPPLYAETADDYETFNAEKLGLILTYPIHVSLYSPDDPGQFASVFNDAKANYMLVDHTSKNSTIIIQVLPGFNKKVLWAIEGKMKSDPKVKTVEYVSIGKDSKKKALQIKRSNNNKSYKQLFMLNNGSGLLITCATQTDILPEVEKEFFAVFLNQLVFEN